MKKIGVFQTEQQVIDTIEQLEQSGFVQGEVKILAKDKEHSRRIEAESNMHVDELRELHEADRDHSSMIWGIADQGYAAASVNTNGLAVFGVPSMSEGVVPLVFGTDVLEEGDLSLGLSGQELHQCKDELESGAIIVMIESDESKALFDNEGGPDLSRLGVAEAVFRRCGATIIADGN